MRIGTFINKLMSFEESAQMKANQVIFEDRDFIEGEIRERLSDGTTSEGTEIANELSSGPRDGAYSKRRAKERRAEGLQTNHIDLKDTGKLYSKIKYKKTAKGGEVSVTDDKDKVSKLENFFGGPDLLWGLTDEQAQFVADRNAQEIADKIAKLIV